jgi:hypothetical protein
MILYWYNYVTRFSLGSLRKGEGGKAGRMRENTERWMELAKLASTEQDPVKLLTLISEINKLLLAKEKRLLNARNLPESS